MTSNEFVVKYKNVEYDIAPFLEIHPGGEEILLEYKNKDITTAFDDIGHSASALKLLNKYTINKPSNLPLLPPMQDVDQNADNTYNAVNNIDNDVDNNVDNNTTNNIDNNNDDLNDSKLSMGKLLKKKLITKEDKLYTHKILGILALSSFIYKYLYMWPTTGALGIIGDFVNYAILICHLLLSTSSLIFHVIKNRIIKNPLIIYEEYRQHAILFTLKAIFVSLSGIHKFPYYIHVLIICIIHLLVDRVTSIHGTKNVTTVRITNDGRYKYLKYFYIYYQLLASACILTPDVDLANLGYNALIAIQSSAFLMTLKRKGIIRWTTYGALYGLALIISMSYMMYSVGPWCFIATIVLLYVRANINISKYTMWFFYIMFFYLVKTYSNLIFV